MSRLVLALVAVTAGALTGPAPAAQAHAFMVASNPADGEVLATSPTQLRLDFSESVVLAATRIDIVDGAGRRIAPTSLKLVSQSEAAGIEAPVEVVADLPSLAHSSYRVSWETLSSDDLHSTSGVLVFGVGQTVTAGGLAEPTPSPLEAGLRWLILLGLSGALGGALAIRLLDRQGGSDAIRSAHLARRLSVRGGLTGAAAAVILLVSQIATSGAGVMALIWSSYGARWGLREAGLMLLVASATTSTRTLGARARRFLLPTGAALACGGTALLGHSGTGATPNVTRVIASAAHLGAAATWAGCVAVLAFVLVRHARGTAPSPDLARAVLRRFGPPAALCVAVLVVTGVYLSSKVIGSVDAALFTFYGRTMLAKVALAGAAGSLALVNTLRLHRRGERATPQRTVMAEAVAAIGILALAGVLTSAQPALEPQLVQAARPPASTIVDGAVVDLQEEVSISPNQPGPSVVLIGVYDTRRPALAPVNEVLVTLLDPSGRGELQRAEKLSNGKWSVSTRLVDAGPVEVKVVARRSGLPDATRSFSWNVGGALQVGKVLVSTTPIHGILEMAATVLLGIALAALALWVLIPWLRRRRRAEAEGGQVGITQMGEEPSWAGERADEGVDQRVGAVSRDLK
jgi:putative copper export protein/methionine-rich copper-binding protein CopC